MHFQTLVFLLLFTCCSFSVTLTNAFGETAEEAAERARSLLLDEHVFGTAVFSSVYASDYADEEALRGHVSSGAEYFAPCFANGDLAMLAMPVSQNWRNALQSKGKNATLTVTSSADPRVPDPRHSTHDGRQWQEDRPTWRRGMPSKQRISLFGHVQRLDARTTSLDEIDRVHECYTRLHPDAVHWTPGSPDSPHVAFWVRFVVDRVYRVGGFGDESAIGWVDMRLWRSAAKRSKAGRAKPPPRPEEADARHDRHWPERLFVENVEADPTDTPKLVMQTLL